MEKNTALGMILMLALLPRAWGGTVIDVPVRTSSTIIRTPSNGTIYDGQVWSGSSLNSSSTILVGGGAGGADVTVLSKPTKLATFTGLGGCKDCNFSFYIDDVSNLGLNGEGASKPVFIIHWWDGDIKITAGDPPTRSYWKKYGDPVTIDVEMTGGRAPANFFGGDGKEVTLGILKYNWWSAGGSGNNQVVGGLKYKTRYTMWGFENTSMTYNVSADAHGEWETEVEIKISSIIVPDVAARTNKPVSINGSLQGTQFVLKPAGSCSPDFDEYCRSVYTMKVSGRVDEPTQYVMNLQIDNI